MRDLILSLFPGIDILGRGFEEEGYCVVRGPDVIWGGDVRSFHPPAGVFEGVIGGPPCQAFSTASYVMTGSPSTPEGQEKRRKLGHVSMQDEFVRCVEEAEADWFLMENVPQATYPHPAGYAVQDQILDNNALGQHQGRTRRFWFGSRGRRSWFFVQETFNRPRREAAVTGDPGRGSADFSLPPRTIPEMLELQGLPPDYLDHQPWTMQAKRKMIGNAVPLPMARAVAQAVRKAVEGADLL